jgi:hypothetical protein
VGNSISLWCGVGWVGELVVVSGMVGVERGRGEGEVRVGVGVGKYFGWQ